MNSSRSALNVIAEHEMQVGNRLASNCLGDDSAFPDVGRIELEYPDCFFVSAEVAAGADQSAELKV